MMLAMQELARERQAAGQGKTASSPVKRVPFTLNKFRENNGPYLSSLLHPESPLNLASCVVVRARASSDEDSSTEEGDEKGDKGPQQEAPRMMTMMEKLMAEERGEKIEESRPPADSKGEEKLKKVQKEETNNREDDDENEQWEILSPYYDDEKRVAVVCPAYPDDGKHRRPLEELMHVIHFTALARDGVFRDLIPSAAGEEEAENQDGWSTKLQRLVAAYTTDRLLALWEEDRSASGAKPLVSSLTGLPWWLQDNQFQKAAIEPVVKDTLTGPWDPPPSQASVDRITTRLSQVVGTALACPSYALLKYLWAEQMERGIIIEGNEKGELIPSTATSFFPVRDEEMMVNIAAHCEETRWALIRAALDGELLDVLKKRSQRLESRLKSLWKKSPTGLLKTDVPPAELPESLRSYFPSADRFALALAKVRELAAAGSSDVVSGYSSAEIDVCVRVLLFFDAVVYDLERTTRGRSINM